MKPSRKSTLYRAASFLIATIVIVYFLPRAGQNIYSYAEGSPWNYTLLRAPFDIPIKLDPASEKNITDSINSSFEPVFHRDLATEKATVSAFAQRINDSITDLTPAERNRLTQAVREIYENGIVSADIHARIAAGDLESIRFIHDNVAVSSPTRGFLSPRYAYAKLDSMFSGTHIHSQFAKAHVASSLVPNILPDTLTTSRMKAESIEKAIAPKGVIQKGERIIDQGQIVTPQLYTILQTYEATLKEKNDNERVKNYYPIGGQVLYVVIIFSLLYTFLHLFRPEYFKDDKKLMFIMLLITMFALFAFVMAATFSTGLYVVPLTILPIMVLVFLDSRTSFFCNMCATLIVAQICAGPLEFIFLQFTAGTIAILSIKDLTRRSQLLRSALFVFVGYTVSYIAIRLIQVGTIDSLTPSIIGCFAINGVLISFAYVFVFLFEKLFGFTSKVTLVELSDINNPILRELSEECPGTFQHSMSVSNLASAAASRIGANVQLVRTGALYHDIGKISNPAFFTENQHGANPHDALDPLQSARIIVGHVTDGLRRAEKANLPEVIKRFISEHHGRGTTRYFYTTYCNLHPGEEVDPAPFTYPGPNPTTKETSILMMADAVEASSRSLKEHSPQAIKALVDRIIDTQIAEGLHNDSPLSFHDIKMIKETFVKRLRTMFHTRISYPEKK